MQLIIFSKLKHIWNQIYLIAWYNAFTRNAIIIFIINSVIYNRIYHHFIAGEESPSLLIIKWFFLIIGAIESSKLFGKFYAKFITYRYAKCLDCKCYRNRKEIRVILPEPYSFIQHDGMFYQRLELCYKCHLAKSENSIKYLLG